MARWLDSLQPLGVFCMRLVLGIAMIVHGWGKIAPIGGIHSRDLLSGVHHFCHFVAALGLPYWLGYISALTEFLGGILLVFGLLTRLTAFFVAFNMAVALLFVNIHQGYHGSEYTLALIALALMILFYGPGTGAMDHRLGLD
jgi:putative oxidoreductase